MGIDWYEMGWKRGYESLTGAKLSIHYPTRDKHSESDENNYCKGYADCIEHYNRNGFSTVEAYGYERENQ